ncbi:hypothetical protein DAC20_32 [Bacteroides phage DAC20]|nr:hypothetical protein DAC19_32 [Bacteroides phage DAC19]QIG63785.1 hypothetical protein DAC20_32 [Bacteroides phage DAC20]QIG64046.1 hypothetical protein DAC22_32 [Bacteroides phage DAC22]QIG64307.1 hypothetical protein DAC23_29 [Bacteroides phage DAC23]
MQKIRRKSKITLFDIKKGIVKKQYYIPNTALDEEGDKIEKDTGIRPIFIFNANNMKVRYTK